MISPEVALARAMARLLPARSPVRLGVAVSGGGDSMALLVLLADWARAQGVELEAVSVDHGLRTESAAETAAAGALAARLGLTHDVVRWARRQTGDGNLMDAARRARQRLIADWAGGRGIGAVALGHTLDDQAETLLMRLGRGSGVDGLAGMAGAVQRGGLLWLRPLLGVRREDLRALLRDRGLDWAEDPTNADARFLRTRARGAWAALAPLGISPERLAETAAAMAQARAALDRAAQAAGLALLRMDRGDALLEARGLDALAPDLRERIVARVLCALSGQPYRPRRAALRHALAVPLRATLHGCVLSREGGHLRIGREWRAVDGLRARPGALWDNRWVLQPAPGAAADGCTVAALGPQGLAQIGAWAACGLPRASVLASPAVWRGDTVLAAPLVRGGSQWRAHLRQGPADLLRGPLSH